MDNSVIMCESYTKLSPKDDDEEKNTNFNEACKTQNSYILLPFLISIALLTAVSIYLYLIKYRAKQKHLLPIQSSLYQ